MSAGSLGKKKSLRTVLNTAIEEIDGSGSDCRQRQRKQQPMVTQPDT